MKSPLPRISIGLPAYKADRWIRSCLDSLLAQTLPAFEIIISDNASSDNTYSICEHYAKRDPRIRLYRQPANIGVRANDNFVFSKGRAPYFCWASANDWYAPTFLERCVAVLDREEDVVLVGVRASTFLEEPGDGSTLAELPLQDFHDGMQRLYAVMASMKHSRMFRGVHRRSAVDPLLTTKPMFGLDHKIVVDLSSTGRLVQISEPLYFERISRGARTSTMRMMERIHHYEPAVGVRVVLFHRIRLLVYYWSLALRQARRLNNRKSVPLGMARVMYAQRSMVLNDMIEFIRLLGEMIVRRRAD